MKQSEYWLHSQKELTEVLQRFESLKPRISDILNTPLEGWHWTAGQICEHLVLSVEGYLPRLGAQEGPDPRAEDSEVVHTWFGKTLIGAMTKPNTPVPSKMEPKSQPKDAGILEEVTRAYAPLVAFVKHVETRDVNAFLMRNPVLKLFRMRTSDVISLHIGHLNRHIKQLENMVDQAGIA